ncbi:hypothetical protein F4703DRAFT_1894607 [Phycomyces blakesleeanus]
MIDLVVGKLLDVPDRTYMSAKTEWQNALQSDILYKPWLAIQNSLPPILIEIQSPSINPLCNAFIYKTYSIVLIVCTNRVSPIQLMAKFKPISEKLWMSLLLPTDFWAQSCFIVSKLTLSSIASSDQLTPLQALSSFLTEASPTLYENQVECDKDVSNVVDIICYNNKKILMKADAALFGVSGSFKAKNLIECALVFNVATKRKYCQTVGSDSDSLLELLPKLKGKPREVIQDKKQDDLEFMINYQKNLIGKMN